MKYVYLLQSINHPDQRYIGLTSDLKNRLAEHNAGKSLHTAKFRPWRTVVAIRFDDDARAAESEQYLKSGSGRAFANRHFWSNVPLPDQGRRNTEGRAGYEQNRGILG